MFAWLTALIKDWPNLINRLMSWIETWSARRKVEKANANKLKKRAENDKRLADVLKRYTDGGMQ